MAGPSAGRRYVRTDYERKVVQVARVCRRLEGGEDVTAVCRDPTMPQRSTLMSWLARYPELRERVEAAAAAAGPEGRRRAYHPYGEAVIAEFLARIEDGRGLVEVCAEGDMPVHSSITRWLNERPEFRERYRLADRLRGGAGGGGGRAAEDQHHQVADRAAGSAQVRAVEGGGTGGRGGAG